MSKMTGIREVEWPSHGDTCREWKWLWDGFRDNSFVYYKKTWRSLQLRAVAADKPSGFHTLKISGPGHLMNGNENRWVGWTSIMSLLFAAEGRATLSQIPASFTLLCPCLRHLWKYLQSPDSHCILPEEQFLIILLCSQHLKAPGSELWKPQIHLTVQSQL